MIKLETLKLLFNDLSSVEKLKFEEWVSKEVNSMLFHHKEENHVTE